jgi:hypothetical protein
VTELFHGTGWWCSQSSSDLLVKPATDYPSREELWLVYIILDLPHKPSVEALADSGSQLNVM